LDAEYRRTRVIAAHRSAVDAGQAWRPRFPFKRSMKYRFRIERA